MKTALNKPYEYESYYQKLGNDKDTGYFDTMKDVMVLSTILGFMKDKHIPFHKPGGDAIKEHLFQDDLNIFDIIAILSTGDIKILLNENRDEKYKLIEEYAHGGIQYLVNNIYEGPITSVDNIIDFVLTFEPEKEEKRFDFGDMISSLVDELEKTD